MACLRELSSKSWYKINNAESLPFVRSLKTEVSKLLGGSGPLCKFISFHWTKSIKFCMVVPEGLLKNFSLGALMKRVRKARWLPIKNNIGVNQSNNKCEKLSLIGETLTIKV